MTDQSKVLITN